MRGEHVRQDIQDRRERDVCRRLLLPGVDRELEPLLPSKLLVVELHRVDCALELGSEVNLAVVDRLGLALALALFDKHDRVVVVVVVVFGRVGDLDDVGVEDALSADLARL